jgi:hypothetical protein
VDHEWIKNRSRNSCASVPCGTRTPLFPEAMAHIEIILQEKTQVVIWGWLLQSLHLFLIKNGVHSPLSSVDSGLVCVWFESGPHFPVRSLARSTQTIVVTTSNWNAVEGQLQRYERATTNEKWRPVGEPISIVVGKNGLGWGIGVLATDDSNFRVSSDPVKSRQIQMVEMIVAD